MTTITADRVVDELRRLTHKLEAETDQLADRLQAAAVADATHKIAYAKALLRAEGTVAEREARAVLASESELLAKRTSEAAADACREAVRALRDQLSAVQSVAATTRRLA